MRQYLYCYILMFAFLITGCTVGGWRDIPILALPIEKTYEDQLFFVQLNQELNKRNLTQDKRIQLLYERAWLYDRLGLSALAQSDYYRILQIKPNIPEIYNHIGIHAMRSKQVDIAYLAFDSALELDSKQYYVYLNRGVTLYNNYRYQQAKEDLTVFYENNTDDPFAMIWLYLAEKELDEQKAKNNLHIRYEKVTDKSKWGYGIIAFYLGEINEKKIVAQAQEDVEDNRMLAERLCEVYFYLGKYYLSKGDNESAKTLFKLSLTNDVPYYIEYYQSKLELEQLEPENKNKSST